MMQVRRLHIWGKTTLSRSYSTGRHQLSRSGASGGLGTAPAPKRKRGWVLGGCAAGAVLGGAAWVIVAGTDWEPLMLQQVRWNANITMRNSYALCTMATIAADYKLTWYQPTHDHQPKCSPPNMLGGGTMRRKTPCSSNKRWCWPPVPLALPCEFVANVSSFPCRFLVDIRGAPEVSGAAAATVLQEQGTVHEAGPVPLHPTPCHPPGVPHHPEGKPLLSSFPSFQCPDRSKAVPWHPKKTILQVLQDHAPFMDYHVVQKVINKELGADPEVLFREFDKVPLAAASLAQVRRRGDARSPSFLLLTPFTHLTQDTLPALRNIQVHHAIAHDGRELAVKVQYPSLQDEFRGDMFTHWIVLNMADMLFDRIRSHSLLFTRPLNCPPFAS